MYLIDWLLLILSIIIIKKLSNDIIKDLKQHFKNITDP